ncbi:unnamed protein product [Polarella glacialis]|uniref:Uncharacterized protein n=1 Tax=Polarella glacialis TaxID=89957 RepID=A0A813G9Q9_POLGL|nr:unnamed protein product [Polarella glacialis]CAE8722121.1 unnamed protein product [Polarella glacialis]|mmetsp:Transcript_2613/g.3911  ORF Transcript_2613/g.3911 Transcript_2613/m.3911 type:complete len:345 (-) Transcript_2613:234-1268(-)|eukprot:CAMPEP_0115060392 /NCGR_PEP_ID=MMETSP0227-20121206/7439_1 /TAXON_ID=89957 /ORGANISM="Polarella glacialis, Strain CCMP 1383" /LENGTH=344 /DNA_ID=CAMNT_0002445603 /DNA_START=110 /DNA_END=1144 /DNA_ORIENTATION=+
MAPRESVAVCLSSDRLAGYRPGSTPSTPTASLSGSNASGSPCMVTPRRRGSLAAGYEGRFGSSIFQAQEKCPPQAAQTPRSARKSGVTVFTDPMNPFARPSSKAIVKVEDARSDHLRAGARTNNPRFIPVEGGERQVASDGRQKLVAYRYGHHEWRPSKRCPDASPTDAPLSPRASRGAREVLAPESAGKSVLYNYLNDMKQCKSSLRAVPSVPSAALQRFNSDRHEVPSMRVHRPERARSLSVDRCHVQAESDKVDSYGFAKKRPVSGQWTSRSNRELLHHEEQATVMTPRTERLHAQADKRFVEMVTHMKEANPNVRKHFEQYKDRNQNTAGLLDNHSPVIC